ncbi:MAG: type II CRISPR RNA-guided endonuclease Cas9, partial [Phycisphaerales bacterium]
ALLGSHLFEAGTDGSMSDIEKGKDAPRNVQRRTARLMRRQAWRRARRKRKLLRLLIQHRLLPSPAELAGRIEGMRPEQAGADLRRPLDIDAYMKALDKVLARTWLAGKGHADHQRLPYLMRAAAAAGPMGEGGREAFGRALYHLAQRRGFESNRRADAKKKDDQDQGTVKAAIGELSQKIAAFVSAGGTATLGAYLASLNPDEQRLRGRWTSRAMYKDEFALMWDTQAGPLQLHDDARESIQKAIFFQRPLKNQKNLIGRCSLIESERRCPTAHRLYQRFRVLQALNHLEVAPAAAAPRGPSGDERAILMKALMEDGDLTFAAARRLLKIKRDVAFNLERGDEKKIVGHRTDAELRKVFGERFDTFSEEDKDRMVEDLRSFRIPEALVRRGRRRWGLPADAAAVFASIELEEGYAPLSLAAIRRLLPRMEAGVPYATARKQEFPGSLRSSEPVEALPPVLKAMDDVRNPSVLRTLTEVRKLVNALTRRLGKPSVIRVELAREIKQPRKVRERLTASMRDREKARSAIVKRIEQEARITRPTRDDIEKVMLADECGWICPYTGRSIGWDTLLGPHSQFDIEHTWPRWRSLDDSLLNKTLCYQDENRSRKRGFTPREAYGGNAERFGEIIDRVRRFKADPFTKAAKIARFQAEEIPADFTNRHLSDTRYIAAAAADYLGLLYGGRVESADGDGVPGVRRVDVCTGGLTAWLRSGWGIAGLLGDTGEKNRDDHRHHAVDAVVVALSDARAVQSLARAASEADRMFKRRAFESIDEPWAGFRDQVDKAVAGVIVSHRQSRRVSGPLHDQCIYRKPITLPATKETAYAPPT